MINSKGQGLTEFALVLPFLLLLIVGVYDLGFAVYANNTITLSAREGARLGVICSKTNAQVETQVRNTSASLDPSKLTVTLSPAGNPCPSVDASGNPNGQRESGKPITVTVTYQYFPLTPMLGDWLGSGGHLNLTGSASMIVE